MRTGKRRSASPIISRELAAIEVPYLFLITLPWFRTAVDPERGREDEPVNNVRKVCCSMWRREGEEFVYEVHGSGFLHHMVRNLAGTFILVGKGTLKPEDVTRQQLLALIDEALRVRGVV